LREDPQPVARLLDRSFHHVAHAQFAAHLRKVHGPALVGETGGRGDDEEPRHPRKRRDDLRHDTVDEEIAPLSPGEIGEGKNGERGDLRHVRSGVLRRFRPRPERQPIAHPGNRLDRLFAQRLPQARDLHRKIALLHDHAGPDMVQKLRLRHHPVGMSVEIGQHVEGPGAE
jgi:hypothetical protein